MDRFVAQFAREDEDLILCGAHGVAYQRDRARIVPYGQDYFEKYQRYEGSEVAVAINRGRIAMVAQHFDPDGAVLDIGVGSGEFIKKRPNTFGFDINQEAVKWLREAGLWADDFPRFSAFTFWDVLEHVEDPAVYFDNIGRGAFLFTSIPIFADLERIRESRHYRPGEHLYYWTERGFVQWMALHRFALLERATFEIEAGRDSIYSFAFRRI